MVSVVSLVKWCLIYDALSFLQITFIHEHKYGVSACKFVYTAQFFFSTNAKRI